MKKLLLLLALSIHATNSVAMEYEPMETEEPTQNEEPNTQEPTETDDWFSSNDGNMNNEPGTGSNSGENPNEVKNDPTESVDGKETSGTNKGADFDFEEENFEEENNTTPEEARENVEKEADNLNEESTAEDFANAAENVAEEAKISGANFWDLLGDFLNKLFTNWGELGASWDTLMDFLSDAFVDLFGNTEYSETTEVPQEESASSSDDNQESTFDPEEETSTDDNQESTFDPEEETSTVNNTDMPKSIAEAREFMNDLVSDNYKLDENSTKSQVKKAFKEAVKECHPDRVSSGSSKIYDSIDVATEKFKQVTASYKMLTNIAG